MDRECVGSANLLAADEDVRGSWSHDGSTALMADGTYHGEMRVVSWDQAWANAMYDWFFSGRLDAVMVKAYGPAALSDGMGV